MFHLTGVILLLLNRSAHNILQLLKAEYCTKTSQKSTINTKALFITVQVINLVSGDRSGIDLYYSKLYSFIFHVGSNFHYIAV